MPQVNLTDELYERIIQFRQVVKVVTEEEDFSVDACAEFIIHHGMDLMLNELLGQAGEGTLLTIIQKLGTRHPSQVYGLLAEAWKLGTDDQKRQDMRTQFGFPTK